ncbi:flagellar motor protein [Chitinivorax sp. B]|uniref:flagellar motor protein n=1 Tax=Chitinivorax sp. B TaxID=2502235 RepID=UPI0010F45841|nr:flagellar motor protein [Chitinivorax sp. B]
MQNFDKISLFGIIIALGAIIGGQVLEGGHISSLLQLTAFMIVIGGTVGAVMLQSSPSVFMSGLRMAKWIFLPPSYNPQLLLKMIIEWSQASRKGGLLALEAHISAQKDPFIRKALQMLVDGAEPEAMRHAMELDINTYEERARRSAKVWEAAGGYAPTIGILGAVMGLIHVMENLSDPSKLGAGIAVAFVATIYGVGCANLLFLPIANKLKVHIENQVILKEMLIDGLIAIANGENPRLVENKLAGYIG